jgi:hypothetical protein
MRVGYEVFHHDVSKLVRFYVSVLGFVALPSEDDDVFVVVLRWGARGLCFSPGRSCESGEPASAAR